MICEGHVELATFDSTADNLIVVSSGDTTFTADTKSHCTPLVEDDSIEIGWFVADSRFLLSH